MNIPSEQLQSILFLKLLVAGHMTIFLTRNTGWLWERPWPAWRLVVALETTQLLGTLAVLFGWLVAPVPLKYVLAVWVYAIVWMFINNAIKVFAYRWLNPMAHAPAGGKQ